MFLTSGLSNLVVLVIKYVIRNKLNNKSLFSTTFTIKVNKKLLKVLTIKVYSIVISKEVKK